MPNTIFTDSLIRANANPLSGGYTTLTGNSALQLVSDNVEGTVIATANAALYTTGTWPADQGMSILIGALANTSTIGVVLRGSTSLNTCYICSIVGTAGSPSTWQIQLDNGGVISTLSSGSVTPSIGDTLYAFIQGNLITFQRNGVTLGTATDSTISTGDAGLYANPATVLADVVISGPVQGFDFVSVTISPTSVNTVIGGQKTFVSIVSGQGVSTSNVTWFVNGVSGGNSTVGTISVAGVYTTPALVPTGGSVTITAQSQADNVTLSLGAVIQIFKNVFVQAYAPNDGNNLTNFKTTCMLFSQNLPTLGWRQIPLTTDTGQVQWANVTSATFKTGVMSNYFNQQCMFNGETWSGTFIPGAGYFGTFGIGGAALTPTFTPNAVTYTDANFPQITWTAATANTFFSTSYTTLTQVVVNTNQTFALTSVATSGAGTGGLVAVYQGTITGGTGNAFVGYIFTVTGFPNAVNNGTFICTVSTATAITLSNSIAVAQTNAASAQSFSTQVGYLGTFTGTSTGNGWVGLSAAMTGFIAGGGQNNLTIAIAASSTICYGGTPFSGTPTNETHSGALTFPPPSAGVNNPNGANVALWQPYFYEIYQSTDTLSATCPIYLKIAYSLCQSTNNVNGSTSPVSQGNSRISISVQVGTILGASVNSNLTSQLSGSTAAIGRYWGGTTTANTPANSPAGEYVINQGFGQNLAGSGIPQECDFSGNGGNLRVCLFRQANAQGNGGPLYFAIERAKDVNGNDLDTYFTVILSSASFVQQTNFSGQTGSYGLNGAVQSTVLKPNTGSVTTGTTWQTITFNQNSLGYQGLIPVFPIFPNPGYVGNPMSGTVVLGVGDTTPGELVRCTIYGQTHTYLVLGGGFSVTQTVPTPGGTATSTLFQTVGMLWENV